MNVVVLYLLIAWENKIQNVLKRNA